MCVTCDNVLYGFRLWFNVGAGLIAMTMAIALFLIVWLSLVKKISSDNWEKHHPGAIPVATASFILGCVWSVYFQTFVLTFQSHRSIKFW